MSAVFPPVPVAEWEAQILADLKGGDYGRKLVWKTPEGLAVRPYYTMETAPQPVALSGLEPWQAAEPVVDIDAAAFQDQGATTVEELAFALAAAVAHLPHPLTIQFATGPLFLLEIAKYRAMRALWATVCEATETGIPLHIHATTALWNKSALDLHNNLLRATAEALAAAIGGANTIAVRTDGIDPHLARNILHILAEESHLNTVADPAAGSWYIEALTTMLASEAWKRFQQIEAAGGFPTFHLSGALDQALEASRKAKEAAYATRRATLVGVNNYPNPDEPVHVPPPTTWRAAGIFERIRLRTARHVAAGNPCPSVLLLELGDRKMSQARAAFCRNFLGCAGFAIHEACALAPADLVILCSSDAEYAELAPRVLSEATMPVVIAGYPKEQIAALEAAGVVGFIHLGSNLPETLEHWQNRLGVHA